MFENPRRGMEARNFTTNAPKILDLKSSSEQIFSRTLPLGAPIDWKSSYLLHEKSPQRTRSWGPRRFHKPRSKFNNKMQSSLDCFGTLTKPEAHASEKKTNEKKPTKRQMKSYTTGAKRY